MLAGLPIYIFFFLQFLVTTAPAPIVTPDSIFTGNIVELDPISTLFPTTVFKNGPVEGRVLPLENLSFIKTVECPKKQLFPIIVFSQIKVWL